MSLSCDLLTTSTLHTPPAYACCLALQATILVALLQPPPEVYDLFDDILLLSDGRVVYHGPREQVVPFFKSVGFAPPERKCVADFLQVSRKMESLSNHV